MDIHLPSFVNMLIFGCVERWLTFTPLFDSGKTAPATGRPHRKRLSFFYVDLFVWRYEKSLCSGLLTALASSKLRRVICWFGVRADGLALPSAPAAEEE